MSNVQVFNTAMFSTEQDIIEQCSGVQRYVQYGEGY